MGKLAIQKLFLRSVLINCAAFREARCFLIPSLLVYSVFQPTNIFLFCLPCDALKMLSCYLETGIWHSFKKENPRRGRRNPAHSQVIHTSPKTHSCRYAHTHTNSQHLVPHVATCKRQASNSDHSALVTQFVNKSLVFFTYTRTKKRTEQAFIFVSCKIEYINYFHRLGRNSKCQHMQITPMFFHYLPPIFHTPL